METKTVIAFEHKKEENIYRLELPHGAPLGEAYEAASIFLNRLAEMINEHAKQTRPLESEEKISDEDVEEIEVSESEE